MLKKYDKFIKDFQQKIDKYFEENSEYIYCHEGCSACCEIGEYPFSWIEIILWKPLLSCQKTLSNKLKSI